MRNMNVSTSHIIQEVITEDSERLQTHSCSTLPRPPPPPRDLLCSTQIYRMLDQESSSSSQPVLVSRGTTSRPPCSFHPAVQPSSYPKAMASAQPCRGASHSGPTRRGRGSSCPATPKNPAGPSSQARTDTELLERILEKPKLVVVEEPKERGMRFRYECEGRSAGSILGSSSTESTKTQPAIEIQGPIEHIKRVTVTVSLVTKDIPHRPHPHCLVGKDCPEGSGICVVTLNPHSNRRHSFTNLGIQCVRRKEMDASLQKRRSQNIDPFRTDHLKTIEDIDMNVVRLCFQCELEWDDSRKDALNPVVSSPIYDKKATTTSQLKISCLNLSRGSCIGKTEIYMLCDKVQKDDIEIIFKRGSWEAKGEFAQTDVHRQIAIVFKSPPYQEQDIAEEVDVSVVLRRLSDRMDSAPVTFTYLPSNPDPYEVKRKRKMKKDINFVERACVAAQTPSAVEPSIPQAFHFPLPESMLVQDERLLSAQPSASTLGEMNYNAPMDSNPYNQSYDAADDPTLLNQLLDAPIIQAVLSDPSLTMSVLSGFDQDPDYQGPYPQDFTQYNDLQFNHLVNESQNSQCEPLPQESPSHLVQVKTEESL
ncbi:transcription factor RelB isoform X2 [Lampris incognitus]|uniref:transcription factor RelB isoform X2 n=1 Tax=Lampris incognitus TaxID=2546036 RepID=UPI0024B52E76|nr:transcription factor RelB isoform X2 [Lampris incognitus]